MKVWMLSIVFLALGLVRAAAALDGPAVLAKIDAAAAKGWLSVLDFGAKGDGRTGST